METGQGEGETDATQVTGSIPDLFNRSNVRNTFVGVMLATIGLVTFWEVISMEKMPCCVRLKRKL